MVRVERKARFPLNLTPKQEQFVRAKKDELGVTQTAVITKAIEAYMKLEGLAKTGDFVIARRQPDGSVTEAIPLSILIE